MPSGQMPPPQQNNPCGYQNMQNIPAAPSGKDVILSLILTIETDICVEFVKMPSIVFVENIWSFLFLFYVYFVR